MTQPALFNTLALEPTDDYLLQQQPRRVQGGLPTTEVVLSAHVARNAEVFNQLAALHIPPGATVADLTYGKGVFWQQIPLGKYNLIFSDIDAKVEQDPVHKVEVTTGIDSRSLPYDNESIDLRGFRSTLHGRPFSG